MKIKIFSKINERYPLWLLGFWVINIFQQKINK